MVHPDNVFFDYTYNTSDLTGIVENGTTSLISYTYDDLGRRFQASRANGAVTNYNYDPIGRLGAFKQNLVGTANDLTINGPAFGGTTIAYNPASQLTVLSRSNDSYAYTGHYNVNRSYGTNGLNQLTSAGATPLGYDLRGNLTSSGSDTYTYTSENRLATRSNGTSVYYDPTGRMSRLVQGLATTKFEYLGPRLVIERDGNGNVLRRYVHGPGDDEPVVWYEGAGLTNKRWLHTDERGSVIAISDAAGTAIATNRYDEYGVPQSTNTGRFQYTGQAWVPELGLYYYKARMYSPTLGRFMQTDPIGYKDGLGWYAYVGDDPVNRVDPSGLWGDSDDDWRRGRQIFRSWVDELGIGAKHKTSKSSSNKSSSNKGNAPHWEQWDGKSKKPPVRVGPVGVFPVFPKTVNVGVVDEIVVTVSSTGLGNTGNGTGIKGTSSEKLPGLPVPFGDVLIKMPGHNEYQQVAVFFGRDYTFVTSVRRENLDENSSISILPTDRTLPNTTVMIETWTRPNE